VENPSAPRAALTKKPSTDAKQMKPHGNFIDLERDFFMPARTIRMRTAKQGRRRSAAHSVSPGRRNNAPEQ
jgi:hypothetical protein